MIILKYIRKKNEPGWEGRDIFRVSIISAGLEIKLSWWLEKEHQRGKGFTYRLQREIDSSGGHLVQCWVLPRICFLQTERGPAISMVGFSTLDRAPEEQFVSWALTSPG